MANCISYSLFGYGRAYAQCYEFRVFLRYLSVNLRMNALLYKGWVTHVMVDKETYESPYREFFDYHAGIGGMQVTVLPRAALCRMMLYRMLPVFLPDGQGGQLYDRVLCRDIDALPTYRERQAVQYWMNSGKTAHAITDAPCHNIALMGGMCGYSSAELKKKLRVYTLDDMMQLAPEIDYTVKGADQDFLNKIILPKVASSLTEHYIQGMPQSFRGDCHNYIQDVPLPIDAALRESNELAAHIGQSGYVVERVQQFIARHMSAEDEGYYGAIEERYPEVFYWKM